MSTNNQRVASINETIRAEIRRIIDMLENLGDRESEQPHRAGAQQPPSETLIYTQLLETIINEYSHNIRDYQANIRCTLQILYELITMNRPHRNSFTNVPPIYSLPSYARSREYYETNHEQRHPRTFGQQHSPPHHRNNDFIRESQRTNIRNIFQRYTNPVTTAEPILPSAQRTFRFPDVFQNVIVRPSRRQISLAVDRFTYTDGMVLQNTSCPITLEDFQDTDQLMRIRYCGHCFRQHALNNWFRENVRCPVCRYDIRDFVIQRAEDLSANTQTSWEDRDTENNQDNTADEETLSELSNESSPPDLNEIVNETTNTFIRTMTTDITNLFNDYMNQSNVSIPTDISNSLIYRFEIPIYYNQEYYDNSDNFIEQEPID
jgi:hypothetical protein